MKIKYVVESPVQGINGMVCDSKEMAEEWEKISKNITLFCNEVEHKDIFIERDELENLLCKVLNDEKLNKLLLEILQ